jgi:hypothetical protein
MFTSIDSPRANSWFEQMQRNRKEGKEPPFRQLEVILDDGEVLEIYHDFIELTGWIAVFRIYEPDGKTVCHTIVTQLANLDEWLYGEPIWYGKDGNEVDRGNLYYNDFIDVNNPKNKVRVKSTKMLYQNPGLQKEANELNQKILKIKKLKEEV